jgi:hypothetical protein
MLKPYVKVRDVRYEVRDVRYEVRGLRYEMRSTKYEVKMQVSNCDDRGYLRK